MERTHYIPTARSLSPERDLCEDILCPHNACMEVLEDCSTWNEEKFACAKHGEIDWSRHVD